MCCNSSNLKGLNLLGGLSGNKIRSIFYGNSPIHRESNLWKEEMKSFSEVWLLRKTTLFSLDPSGVWELVPKAALAPCCQWGCAPGVFLCSLPGVRCTETPPCPWAGTWRNQRRLWGARRRRWRKTRRRWRSWQQSWQRWRIKPPRWWTSANRLRWVLAPLWAPGKAGKGIKSSLDPTDIPLSLQSNQAVTVVWFYFLYSPGNLSCLGEKLTPGFSREIAGFKSCLNI